MKETKIRVGRRYQANIPSLLHHRHRRPHKPKHNSNSNNRNNHNGPSKHRSSCSSNTRRQSFARQRGGVPTLLNFEHILPSYVDGHVDLPVAEEEKERPINPALWSDGDSFPCHLDCFTTPSPSSHSSSSSSHSSINTTKSRMLRKRTRGEELLGSSLRSTFSTRPTFSRSTSSSTTSTSSTTSSSASRSFTHYQTSRKTTTTKKQKSKSFPSKRAADDFIDLTDDSLDMKPVVKTVKKAPHKASESPSDPPYTPPQSPPNFHTTPPSSPVVSSGKKQKRSHSIDLTAITPPPTPP